MKDFRIKFYELHQFLGCYFHQFWKEDLDFKGEDPNFEAVVRYYKLNNSPESVSKATEMLQNFLALDLSEKEIDEIFSKNGIWYRPQYRGMSDRQWLEAVLRILTEKTPPKSTLKFA